MESRRALLRHRLLDEIASERVAVLVTDPLMWELMAVHALDAGRFLAMQDFLARATRLRVLVDPIRRREREVRLGRPLTFDEFVDDERYLVPLHDPKVIADSAAAGRERADLLRSDEERKALSAARGLDEMVAAMRAGASGQSSEVAESEVWRTALKLANKTPKYGVDFARDVARDDVERTAKHLGVDASVLAPMDLPTFSSAALIHTARIRAVLVAGHSPTGNKTTDQIDLLHLDEAGSYGDVFVSSDRRLCAFASTVSNLRCDVVAFEEWSDRLTR